MLMPPPPEEKAGARFGKRALQRVMQRMGVHFKTKDEEAGEARRGHSGAVPLQRRAGGRVGCRLGTRGGGWSRLGFRGLGLGRFVLDGLIVGGADGIAPGIGAVGVDEFVLGDVQGLHEGLAEIGEGGGGFRFDLAEGDGGEEASESGTEIAGGQEVAGQVIGDVFAGGLASEGLRVLASVERAEIRMGGAGGAALAAVGKGEGTQRGTIVGAIGGHGISRKKV